MLGRLFTVNDIALARTVCLGRDCTRELRAMSSILLPSPFAPLEQDHLPQKGVTTSLSTVICGHLGHW